MGDTIVVRFKDDYVALAPGTRIGRYVVRSVLGHGSFGITYLAHDGQLGSDVAIKEYLPMALAVRHNGVTVVPNSTRVAEQFTWGRDRFIEEGHTLAGFRGRPGMVHVYDLVEDNGTAYIVMELVQGSTLDEKLERDGPLSVQDVYRLLPPLLDVLATVHQAGFVHRDIKPANILLDREGRPILIDFGAARAAMAARTTAMTAVFTPGYAAVEQFIEAKQGPWTDIYGLSATFYRAISGCMPPRSVERALDDGYQPLADLKPAGFPVQLLRGIDRGLAVRPADRPQTIEQWRAALFSAQAAAPPAAPALGRRWRTVVYAGVGSLAVVAAAGTILLVRPANRTAWLEEALDKVSKPAGWLQDAWDDVSKPAGLLMPGIDKDGEQSPQKNAEASPGEDAETAARPEVALPRAEAQDLASADSAYKRGDFATALQLVRPLADAGNSRAQTYLGIMYDNGQGVPQDDAQAVAWYRKAAGQGDPRAQTNLGAAYESGRGVARDLGQAIELYRKAADQQDVAAEYILGRMYATGRGIPQDYGQAAEWFRKAADHGNAGAQFNLGFLYGEGRGVPQDRGQALALYRKAANQGHTGAQTNLGAAYEAGQGVEKDFAQAADWYRKAADQGNAVAQYNLGKLYGSGRGVPQDYREAMGWYRKAAAQDHALAGATLGYAYDVGRGVPQDPAQAANWYRKAVDDGSVDSMYALGLLYQKGRGVPQDVVQADRWITLAVLRYAASEKIKRERAVRALKDLESTMTPEQIERAQTLVREWTASVQ
ncbi:TPR repeat [Rhodospirillales bacterium URHD0017]|nr:TPR repeat [Rhodospirillales bacterium URHD0017]